MAKSIDFSFKLVKKDSKTRARRGIIKTPHGEIQTPAFSPVATKATVKALSPNDLKTTNTQVVLANTYHLYLQPGTEIIKKFGGFPNFMNWPGPTITDSGGYQVAFMWGQKPKITEEGAVFKSHIDGTKHLLTPEKSMEIQKILGADIIMAFDNPLDFEQTLRWEERSFNYWKKINKTQALFGIIQGDTDKILRKASLKFILEMGFPGLAIGGESIGIDPIKTEIALETIQDMLPDNLPLHALGLGGGPEGVLRAVAKGVDIFDNTSVTRMGRTGILFIYPEDGGTKENKYRTDFKKSKYKNVKTPVSKICKCELCTNFSTAYLNHLFSQNEILGLRLASIHNVTFMNDFMSLIRIAIEENKFKDLYKSWL